MDFRFLDNLNNADRDFHSVQLDDIQFANADDPLYVNSIPMQSDIPQSQDAIPGRSLNEGILYKIFFIGTYYVDMFLMQY